MPSSSGVESNSYHTSDKNDLEKDPSSTFETAVHEGEIQKETDTTPTPTFTPTWSVICIFVCLSLFSFLAALDGTIITTALPTITNEIGGGGDELYLWIAQCFMFTSTVLQLLYGQLANIFGRRNPYLVAIAMFTLGSGVAGGAKNPTMLIAGRSVQGAGAAGLYVLSDIITCDIVPARYRGPYVSVVLSAAGVGSTIGPIIGGALAEHNWRWIFYLNVPIAAVGFVVMIILLKLKHERSPSWSHALRRVDYVGTIVFVPSMISLFFGLISGGTQHPWASWRVVVPLVLGVCGWILFHLVQTMPKLCPEPSMPLRLFAHRTSSVGYLFVFLSSVVLQAIAYFLPLYFQSVKLTSPLLSGVYYLPFALAIVPFAGGGGWVLTKWGQYIPLHYAGFAFLAIGTGLFSMLNETINRGAWIGFQILPAAGIGLIYTATLPSTLAALPDSDVAVAVGTYSFIRSFGFVWGITISGAVFNTQIDANLDIVTTERLKNALRNGAAYAFAADGNGLHQLPADELRQATSVYVQALRVVWLVSMAIALLGFVCVPIERKLKLRTENNTDFGLQESKEKSGQTEKP